MAYKSGSRDPLHNPKNGTQRVATDPTDGSNHLRVFMNGSWLFILSALPAVIGGTLSVVLIEYSPLLSYLGLGVVIGFAALSVLRLRRELNARRMLATKLKVSNTDSRNIESSIPGDAVRGLPN
jgi:hypothetical protein